MSIRDLLSKHQITMAAISRRYGIPYRTLQNWAAGTREAPAYVIELLDRCLSANI